MVSRKTLIAGLAVVLALAITPLAETQDKPLTPELLDLVYHDTSPPLRDMPRGKPREQGERVIVNKVPPDMLARYKGAPDLPDPLLAIQAAALPSEMLTPAPSSVFQGLSNDDNAAVVGGRIVPPDTEGDVGPDHYVQSINLTFAVYDKTTGSYVLGGGPRANSDLWQGIPTLCGQENDGDPVVLYDHLADRWAFMQFALVVVGNSVTDSHICVAVSQTSDPTGAYHRYDFHVSPDEFDDYPKMGLWEDGYYLSANQFDGATGGFNGAIAVAFEREQMLLGNTAQSVKFGPLGCGNECFFSLQPSDLDGPAPAAGTPNTFVMAFDDQTWGTGTNLDGYRLWDFSVDWATPGSSTFTSLGQVDTANFDANLCNFGACVPQPAPGEALDTLSQFTMFRAQQRDFGSHRAMVVSHNVDVGANRAGMRWAELRDSGSGWSLHQTGTFAPADGLHRWMGSAAMDGAGNIGLGYSVSSAGQFPSVWYTSRQANDTLGTMPGGEQVMVAGSDVQVNSFNRWGDYSSMSVDPADDCTFWYTQEFQQNDDTRQDFDFKTIIGAFALPGCGDPCGNGVCEAGEDCVSCPADCEIVTSGAVCGNGTCEAGNGEDCLSCPADCNGRQGGKPANRFCCGDGDGQNPVGCNDPRCTDGFDCTDVPVGPGTFCCGDGTCDPVGENCSNCALDCPLGAEICTGGVDEDCDGDGDCDDQDCLGPPPDPACEQVDCSTITDRKLCNAEPNCRWDNRNKVCIPN